MHKAGLILALAIGAGLVLIDRSSSAPVGPRTQPVTRPLPGGIFPPFVVPRPGCGCR